MVGVCGLFGEEIVGYIGLCGGRQWGCMGFVWRGCSRGVCGLCGEEIVGMYEVCVEVR